MEKCKYLKDENDPNKEEWEKKFKNIEGVVTFSEKKKMGGEIQYLCLNLKGHEKGILIKENHRIDVGELVRVHYKAEGQNIFCGGYEIIGPKGNVIHRYANNDKYIFAD